MKKILYLSLVILAACSAKKQTVDNKIKLDDPLKLEISINDNERISIGIKNTLNESVYLFQTEKLHIERNVDEKWQRLRILPCPCDAPCARPEESRELSSMETLTFNWNKEESWCGTKKTNHIRNTETSIVEPGNYRIRFLYKIGNEELKYISKEFVIN